MFTTIQHKITDEIRTTKLKLKGPQHRRPRLDSMPLPKLSLLLLTGVLFYICAAEPTNEECKKKPNEVLGCSNGEGTCEDPFPHYGDCGHYKCICKYEYVRAPNGTCIRWTSCPNACPEDEMWDDCGSCERTCVNPYPDPTKCTCERRCRCVPILVRSSTGKCIYSSECIADINPCMNHMCNEDETCVAVESNCTYFGCSKKAVCVKSSCASTKV
uniref:TIL domain-containing protein n=1 Tax=Steinernema glaseri TaxID=37863 RepID=A0A1I7Z1B8_9BILA